MSFGQWLRHVLRVTHEMATSKMVGVILILSSTLAVAMASYASVRSQHHDRCESAVMDAFIKASQARAVASTEDRRLDRAESEATTKLIHDVFAASSSAEAQRIYMTYRIKVEDIANQRARVEADRRSHPLPQPPSQACR